MKMLLYVGLLLMVLGMASLIFPIRQTETQDIRAGGMDIGLHTTHSERVSPIISIVLIAGGIALSIAGGRISFRKG